MGADETSSAMNFLFVAWALAGPTIIALGSIFRMIERRGIAQFFAVLALLGISALLLSVLIEVPGIVSVVAAGVAVGSWLISLAMSTRRRALTEIGLFVLALVLPVALGLLR